MYRYISVAGAGLASALPFVALAQSTDLDDILETLLSILNILAAVVVAIAVLYFLWGLAQYILSSGDSTKFEEGRNKMIWGILAIFVMVSLWGLVNVVQGTFNVREDNAQVPQIPTAN